MNRFVLTTRAELDLEDIWIYLAARDHLIADRQITQILDK
jgi:plasmid stabilization system protein ParE